MGYARRLGLTGSYPPYLSLALGSAESTLLEMTSAYSAFANQGVRMTPYAVRSVTDREGMIIEENRPEPREALRADTAFLMAHLLEGVVQRGTAVAARSLEWPLAGKTGTMDEFTDAWFVGFDPDVTVGVWVGYDEKRPLGSGETGAQAALPIWIDYMRAYIGTRGSREHPAAVRGARQHRLRHAPERRHRGVHQRHAARRADRQTRPPRSPPPRRLLLRPKPRRRRRRTEGLEPSHQPRVRPATTRATGWPKLDCGHRQHMRHRPPLRAPLSGSN